MFKGNMSHSLPTGSHACKCKKPRHETKRVVLTGGPGGGKTAILEMARRYFCQHVAILPEAASIVFGGGFPRVDSAAGRRAAQRAIFHVQRQMESVALENHETCVVLCDRGTLDGLAYWPGSDRNFFEEFDITLATELARYSAVIHVEVPALGRGYERNGIRKENVAQARAIDRKIAKAWRKHPHHMVVGAQSGFLDKLAYAIELLRSEVPVCCQTHLHATIEKPK
jgi:predicted ATPase